MASKSKESKKNKRVRELEIEIRELKKQLRKNTAIIASSLVIIATAIFVGMIWMPYTAFDISTETGATVAMVIGFIFLTVIFFAWNRRGGLSDQVLRLEVERDAIKC